MQERNVLSGLGDAGFCSEGKKTAQEIFSIVTPYLSTFHEGERYSRLYKNLSGPTVLETSNPSHLFFSKVRNHCSLLTCICLLLSCCESKLDCLVSHSHSEGPHSEGRPLGSLPSMLLFSHSCLTWSAYSLQPWD